MHNVFVMPQCMHMGKNPLMQSLILIQGLILQSFILIGGYVAMWATLIGGYVAMWATLIEDTSMAKLTVQCEMQGNAIARVAVDVR